jgi:hypothetical protein
MRQILTDECINPRLVFLLHDAPPDDVIETVRDLGWTGRRDHILIPQINSRFDIFLTIDKVLSLSTIWSGFRLGSSCWRPLITRCLPTIDYWTN